MKLKKEEAESDYLRNQINHKNKLLLQFNSFVKSQNSDDSKTMQITKLLYQNKNLMKENEILRTKNKQMILMY